MPATMKLGRSALSPVTLDAAVPPSIVPATGVVGDSLQCDQLWPEFQQGGRTFRKSTPLVNGSTTSESGDGSSNFDHLPDELLLQIFSYLSLSENINVLQEVCTRWRALAQDAELWYNKEYVISEGTSEESAILTFRAAPQLRSVVVEKIVSSSVLAALSQHCHNLTTLDMCLQLMTLSEAKKFFDGCKQIQTLRISQLMLLRDRQFVEAMAQLPELRVLQLKPTRNMGLVASLDLLTDGCPRLLDLELGDVRYRMPDAEHFVTSRKHLLKRLCVRWTSVEGRSIVPLLVACAHTLECLHLKCYDVPEEEAARSYTALGQLHGLRELVLDTAHVRLSHVAPLAFRDGGLSRLERLSMWCVRDLGDETLVAVCGGCPQLRELSLVACGGLSDAALQPLCQLKQLHKLKISSYSCLGREAIRYISKLPALHTLHFHAVRFENLVPGVECFLDMSGLCCLYLSDSTCWPIPFGRFPGRLTNLRELHIEGCEGDQGQVDHMCTQMPELQVEGVFGTMSTDDLW